ncbi:PREDICTED: uncharacterized protein LOC105457727 [Wasmannia auropunctata]|uniref:uncharacterized protein LOC105457727 n=1 Tax=Wasmannia auropunctata TaxID=64793 RepID=UPI0005ED9DAA|nr:PREDICTED: uncharacterized protein LOC105457727 [Wasmannia auropunctata]
MSQMNNSKLNQNNKRRRVTVDTVQTSTPITPSVRHNVTISLSEIDTASSSSGGRTSQLQDLVKKHIKHQHTKEKERPEKRKIRDSDLSSDWEKEKELIKKQKKNLKSQKKATKREKLVTKDTDSEWETELEKSVNKFSINSRGSTRKSDDCIVLFKDPCTPEKIRDVPYTYKEILLESPIIQSSRRTLYLLKKDNILQNELLPINLLPAEVRNPEETSEDETIFDNKGNAEIHVSLRESEKSPKQKSEKFATFKSHSKFPRITNSLRQNQPVKTYLGKVSRHSELSVTQSSLSPINYTDFMRRLPDIPKEIESPIPPGMIRCYGYYNKALRKCILTRKFFSGK